MKAVKKIIILLMITLITFITTTVFAANKGKAIEDTKLKKSMDDTSITLEIIPKNDEFEILEDQGEWYRVNYMKIRGYVHKEYVEETNKEEEKTDNKLEEANQENTNNNEQNQEAEGENSTQKELQVGSNVYTKEECNIKVRPLINSIKLQTLQANQEVTVIEIANGWVYVATNNIAGWVRKDNLNVSKVEENIQEEVQEPKEESKQEQPTINKTGYITSDGINFRKEPNTDSEILKTFLQNAKVTILQEEGKWYKVKHNDQEGYILKMYVSENKIEITSRSSETRPINEIIQQEQSQEQSNKPVQAETSNTTTQSNYSKASGVVALAKKYLGSRYIYGGSSPSGFDCSRINNVYI